MGWHVSYWQRGVLPVQWRVSHQGPEKLLSVWREWTVGGCWSMVWRCNVSRPTKFMQWYFCQQWKAVVAQQKCFLFTAIRIWMCQCYMPVLSPMYVLTCLCAEISCGPPLIFPHTNLLWDHTSRPGSTVWYECVDGFYLESGNNMSVCSIAGEWEKISVKCRGTVIISIQKHVSIQGG